VSEGNERVIKEVEAYKENVRNVQQKIGKIEQYDGRIAAVEEKQSKIEKNPLELFGKDGFFKEIAESAIKKIEDKARDVTARVSEEATRAAEESVKKVGEAINAQMPDIGQRVADAINSIDEVQPGTIEETIERKREHKHKIRFRNRVLGALGGIIVLGSLGLGGWAAYDSSKRTAEGAAGVAKKAFNTANFSLKETGKNKEEFESYKTGMAKTLEKYETKEQREEAVNNQIEELKIQDLRGNYTALGERLNDLEGKATENYNALLGKLGEIEGNTATLQRRIEDAEKNYGVKQQEYSNATAQFRNDVENFTKEVETYKASLDKTDALYTELSGRCDELMKVIEQLRTVQDASSIQLTPRLPEPELKLEH
jgi:predicted  nucleic acid-binding Zn-ribbon protein